MYPSINRPPIPKQEKGTLAKLASLDTKRKLELVCMGSAARCGRSYPRSGVLSVIGED